MSAAATDRRALPQRARLAGLYAVTPDTADTEHLASFVAAAIAGGATAIQYRNKSAAAALRRTQAVRLAEVCAAGRALFIVNDDAQLARDVGADGVHLGCDDGAVAAARAVLPAGALVGVSCYNELARARVAVAQGADYVAFGSFFPSQVKPGARRADVALLAQAKVLGVPVVAIGGIDATNARTLAVAGADAIAVISAVFAHADAAAVTRAATVLAAIFSASGQR